MYIKRIFHAQTLTLTRTQTYAFKDNICNIILNKHFIFKKTNLKVNKVYGRAH